jgi:hypothetical protein
MDAKHCLPAESIKFYLLPIRNKVPRTSPRYFANIQDKLIIWPETWLQDRPFEQIAYFRISVT